MTTFCECERRSSFSIVVNDNRCSVTEIESGGDVYYYVGSIADCREVFK
jgi:hypothetical protein